MTEPTYLLTESQRGILMSVTDVLSLKATEMLQSLPIVSGEPVGYVNGDELDNIISDGLIVIASEATNWRKTKLYTSPQPLTPITADDVTGEMIGNYVSAHQNIGSPMLSEQIAAAYNAVIKNRSEAR